MTTDKTLREPLSEGRFDGEFHYATWVLPDDECAPADDGTFELYDRETGQQLAKWFYGWDAEPDAISAVEAFDRTAKAVAAQTRSQIAEDLEERARDLEGQSIRYHVELNEAMEASCAASAHNLRQFANSLKGQNDE